MLRGHGHGPIRARLASSMPRRMTLAGTGSGRDTAAISRELDAYNAAAAKICADRGVVFIDIAPVSRAASSGALILLITGSQ